MLGEPLSMLVPQVVGFRLYGRLREGATATDLVLTVTELLRKTGVVGKFVEYFGEGARRAVGRRPRDAREHVARVRRDLRLLPGRRADARLPAPDRPHAPSGSRSSRRTARRTCSGTSRASAPDVLAGRRARPRRRSSRRSPGPRRPQDRVPLGRAKQSFREALDTFGVDSTTTTARSRRRSRRATRRPSRRRRAAEAAADAGVARRRIRPSGHRVRVTLDGEEFTLDHGAVVIAAITSCTNTSNPQVMIAAGLVAKKAVERGLHAAPVGEVVARARLARRHRLLRARGPPDATSTSSASTPSATAARRASATPGPLPDEISAAIADGDLVACAVLSGNRNFEARIHPEVKANYLASPPLVVAYALAGRMDVDLETEPLGQGSDGADVFLRDVWPSAAEIAGDDRRVGRTATCSRRTYADVFTGDEAWREPAGARRRPLRLGAGLDVRAPADLPRGHAARAGRSRRHRGRALPGRARRLGHDRPHLAGRLDQADSPAGRYLVEHGVEPRDFNSYGARRGNHEVMVRGTFANVRLRNLLVPGSEGTWTVHVPSGERDDDLRRVAALPRRGHAAGRARRQGVRHRARRATGPRRARCCSACAR